MTLSQASKHSKQGTQTPASPLARTGEASLSPLPNDILCGATNNLTGANMANQIGKKTVVIDGKEYQVKIYASLNQERGEQLRATVSLRGNSNQRTFEQRSQDRFEARYMGDQS